MPPIDINQLFKAAGLIVILGVVILALTYLVQLIVPLLILGVIIVVGYLLYKYFGVKI